MIHINLFPGDFNCWDLQTAFREEYTVESAVLRGRSDPSIAVPGAKIESWESARSTTTHNQQTNRYETQVAFPVLGCPSEITFFRKGMPGIIEHARLSLVEGEVHVTSTPGLSITIHGMPPKDELSSSPETPFTCGWKKAREDLKLWEHMGYKSQGEARAALLKKRESRLRVQEIILLDPELASHWRMETQQHREAQRQREHYQGQIAYLTSPSARMAETYDDMGTDHQTGGESSQG